MAINAYDDADTYDGTGADTYDGYLVADLSDGSCCCGACPTTGTVCCAGKLSALGTQSCFAACGHIRNLVINGHTFTDADSFDGCRVIYDYAPDYCHVLSQLNSGRLSDDHKITVAPHFNCDPRNGHPDIGIPAAGTFYFWLNARYYPNVYPNLPEILLSTPFIVAATVACDPLLIDSGTFSASAGAGPDGEAMAVTGRLYVTEGPC